MSGTTPFDCPRCGAGLAMSERQGIEIDYCPQCRGVWLDRGELDKLIERSATAAAPGAPPPPGPSGSDWAGQGPAGAWTSPAGSPPPLQQQPWGGGGQGHGYGHGGKRRKSFLEEIFG